VLERLDHVPSWLVRHREQRVAALAEGRSNRQVATALVVPARTVEWFVNHE
jgi:hypothetical protein